MLHRCPVFCRSWHLCFAELTTLILMSKEFSPKATELKVAFHHTLDEHELHRDSRVVRWQKQVEMGIISIAVVTKKHQSG